MKDIRNSIRGDATFLAAYKALESHMANQAEEDGDVFLPSLTPDGPVDYILICMEPSLGRWAKTATEARAKVKGGFRNFVYSLDDFIVHYCARRYLCNPDENYYITDLSKGAMLVEHAELDRVNRYNRWYKLLEDELDLVSKQGAAVVAVGNMVSQHLKRNNFGRAFNTIIHYSGQAAAARKNWVVGHESEFDEFKNSVTLDDILINAKTVLDKASVPKEVHTETLDRLHKAKLTESRRRLIFIYKTTFESLRLRQGKQIA